MKPPPVVPPVARAICVLLDERRHGHAAAVDPAHRCGECQMCDQCSLDWYVTLRQMLRPDSGIGLVRRLRNYNKDAMTDEMMRCNPFGYA